MTTKKLSPTMETALIAAYRANGNAEGTKTNTLVALIDRGLVTTSHSGKGHLLTIDGIHAAENLLGVNGAEIDATIATMNATMRQTTTADMAQDAANVHMVNACKDPFDSPAYEVSKQALIDAIIVAYPDVDPDAVYNVWADCNESIAYCVDHVKANPVSRWYTVEESMALVTDDDYPALMVDMIPTDVDIVDDRGATFGDTDQASEGYLFDDDLTDGVDCTHIPVRPAMMVPRAPRTAMSVRERTARKSRRKAQKRARKAMRRAGR